MTTHKDDLPSHSRIEDKFTEIISPVEKFATNQISSSVLLLIATLAALVLATNDQTSDFYAQIINYRLGFRLGDHYFNASLQYWVNDILLAVFFFLIGLELKRDFLVGELRNPKKMSLVAIAAAGGMLIPALIYYLFNYTGFYAGAWGIPIATDTAFVLGILAIFRKDIPKTLITFVVAISIFDDVGAIGVIAIFYTPHFHLGYFSLALCGTGLLFLINILGVRKPLPYILIGIVVWAGTELSGVHATLAGILIALTIPARPKHGSRATLHEAKQALNEFETIHNNNHSFILEDDKKYLILKNLQEIAKQGTTPLQHWGNALEKPVGLFILPLFALTNAGINVELKLLNEAWQNTIVLGVFFGLIVGKFIGISLPCIIARHLGFGHLPPGVTIQHIIGVGLLSGIGFTMSIFIADLSFVSGSSGLATAKIGILFTSLVAGLLSYFWFRIITRRPLKTI